MIYIDPFTQSRKDTDKAVSMLSGRLFYTTVLIALVFFFFGYYVGSLEALKTIQASQASVDSVRYSTSQP